MTTQTIDRYPHDWATRSRDTKRSRKQGKKVQCSCCGKFHPWDNVEVHHSSYQGESDRAGVNIFPVCGSKQDPGTCHHLLHQKGNWIKDKNIWFNRNSDAIVRRLQKGYAGDSSIDVPWLGIVGALGAIAIGWFVVGSFIGGAQPVRRLLTESVNVRQGPGIAYLKAGKPLAKGTAVEVLEEKDGWVRIDGGRWIAGNYTKAN